MVQVKLWGTLSASVGGDGTIDIDAKTVRQLFRKLPEAYPATAPYVKQGLAVSINGEIVRDDWSRELPEDAEIYVLPRMAGG